MASFCLGKHQEIVLPLLTHFRYVSLDLSDQRKLARQIGTTAEQIVENLLEIKSSVSFF
jgi:hypothetical protein